VELAGPDIEALAREQKAAQAELAVALGIDESAEAAEHRLVAQEDDVGGISLSCRMDVHRGIETIPRLGEQLDDAGRRLLVHEQVWAIQALLQRVDNSHGRGVSSGLVGSGQIGSGLSSEAVRASLGRRGASGLGGCGLAARTTCGLR